MSRTSQAAKSASAWGPSELNKFRINVISEDSTTLFGGPLPDPLSVRPEILTTPSYRDVPPGDRHLLLFLRSMEAASSTGKHERDVNNFTPQLLYEHGYLDKSRDEIMVRGKPDIEFDMCGESKHAIVDFVIEDLYTGIVLLVQENKRAGGPGGGTRGTPEAQLIAEAIAAFSQNNRIRRMCGDDPLDRQTIPGIQLTGTYPTFYKVTVTEALVRAIREGTDPDEETIVYAHCPDLAAHTTRNLVDQGMMVSESRRIISSSFVAFKQFLPHLQGNY
ncbi:hypothetical protein JVT61DRAFT_6705 [Boletus reticuloceps]|uniref:Uncharacterized protein n=1 Tax=Boletus reticuloceps TaxID=495285 RepID=A0A8I3A650_9AGAM|nr:hypothetical protein JVT61DRAFT_6705 [Boletus reticuloceps]